MKFQTIKPSVDAEDPRGRAVGSTVRVRCGMHTLNRRRDSDTPPVTPPGGATMNHCSHS